MQSFVLLTIHPLSVTDFSLGSEMICESIVDALTILNILSWIFISTIPGSQPAVGVVMFLGVCSVNTPLACLFTACKHLQPGLSCGTAAQR